MGGRSQQWSIGALLVGAALLASGTAFGENNEPEPTQADKAAAYRSELEALGREKAASEARQRVLRSEITRLKSDQVNIQTALVRSADQVRTLNRSIDDGVRSLQANLATQSRLKQALVAGRADLADVLATLQRIGRHPPPALAARPSDALGAIRSAILMGAVMPEIRGRTEKLQQDLATLAALRAEIDRERTALEADAARYGEENARLELLLEEKRNRRSRSEAALSLERERTADLAEKAVSLNGLIESLAAPLLPDNRTDKPDRGIVTRPSPDLFQSVPFADLQGSVRLPADGVPLRRFGDTDSSGEAAKGMALQVIAYGRIYAPADARVVYAGPFRSYGELLILDAGDGYHVVLSGMERIDVGRDQFVLAGEPVGRMGATRYASAGTIDMQSSEPVLYIEFRKGGRSIDPDPWWATPEAEKVGG
ncbi:MAG: peptidoglycan DD-metalloendopeptidase family protein [Pseudomonadota bacterium]